MEKTPIIKVTSDASEENVCEDTSRWYNEYYTSKGIRRNDLLLNPEVLYQVLVTQAATIEVLREAGLDRDLARVLDVGCGEGASLALLLQLGFKPSGLVGLDILPDRVGRATERYPSMQFVKADAADMPWADGEFDLVMESTMFVQLADADLSRRIADEMRRVSRRFVLLIDWRYGKKGYRAVTRRRIKKLFPEMHIVSEKLGALVPPVGRRLSRLCPSLYLPVHRVFPVLAGLRVTLLEKDGAS